MTADPALRLAATCIPVRETSIGLEVLMVRRNPDLSFGGMWTFPGGVLEDADGPAPDDLDEDQAHWGAPALLSTAANGAVRETLEETALSCNLSSLAWFSHWMPPKSGAPKRFATWFFIAPEHAGEIELDLSENDDYRWTTPADALAANAAGGFPLAPPTWITLDDLGEFDSVPSLVDHVITQGARLHHTKSFATKDGRIVCWEGDAAYDSGDADAPGPRNRARVDKRMQIVERLRG